MLQIFCNCWFTFQTVNTGYQSSHTKSPISATQQHRGAARCCRGEFSVWPSQKKLKYRQPHEKITGIPELSKNMNSFLFFVTSFTSLLLLISKLLRELTNNVALASFAVESNRLQNNDKKEAEKRSRRYPEKLPPRSRQMYRVSPQLRKTPSEMFFRGRQQSGAEFDLCKYCRHYIVTCENDRNV